MTLKLNLLTLYLAFLKRSEKREPVRRWWFACCVRVSSVSDAAGCSARAFESRRHRWWFAASVRASASPRLWSQLFSFARRFCFSCFAFAPLLISGFNLALPEVALAVSCTSIIANQRFEF
ncbi:hypothetical protein AHAS_Ahas17G0055300 [Arachis hypogaea]|uniref:Uncharacterized protein n=1 Tax=Arachis hypogaea TaxID=3818 RepID=A0A444YE74_ARAHY|nr:hypothetical protein Ahy_B07g088338 [Arachis hypogaea]